MGQVNSSIDLENGTDLGTSIVVGVPNGEDDSRGSNQSGDAITPAARDKMDSIHCVKTRIDMLIEDCLNVKEVTSDDNTESNKQGKNGDKENQSKATKDSSESEKTDKPEVKAEDIESRSSGSDVVIVDKQTESGCKVDVKVTGELGDKPGGNTDTKDNGEKSAEKKQDGSPAPEQPEKKEHKALKMSDLINDMNAADIVQRHKRAVTTFQTFIDKVLDSSLKQVTDQETIPTNILKLCQESMQPNAEAVKGEKAGGSTSPAVKPKFDKSCTKIKPERKITLKDHIERFLEISFHEETGVGSDKNAAKPSEEKKEGNGTKNGLDNFNAQGLVNNMITQGLQINKLLSPPILVNHSKNPQKSPDIRVHSDYLRHNHDERKEPPHSEVKSELQVPSVSHNVKSDERMNKGYGYHSRGVRPGPQMHMPQLSPGQMNNSCHDGHKIPVKDMRENHAQMSDPKMYDSRRDYMYARQYSTDFNPDHLPRPHPAMAGPGYQPRVDHPTSMSVLEQAAHHPMMYPMAPTARTSVAAAAPYPHHLSVPSSAAIDEQRSPLGRPGRHPMHHKDCMCPMCVGAMDPRDPREAKKLDYHAQRGHSPNVPPMYMVSHELPLHLRGHPLDSTAAAAAMMRPSHPAKLPHGPTVVAAAYQNMPKMLPQHAPQHPAQHVPQHPPQHTPQHPAMATSKEYGPQLMVPGMGYHQGRRPSLPENTQQRPYIHPGTVPEYGHSDQTEDYTRRPDGMGRGSNLSPYPVRPSSLPSHENSSHDSYPSVRRSPAMSDSGSRSSEASTTTEAPLDLSVKKTKAEMERPRSSSYGNGAQHPNSGQKKLNPSNTFLRHLENSVDKYCQELSVPPEQPGSMKPSRPPMNRSLTPGESKQALPYPVHSPRLPSPHSMYNYQQQRKLPSPHFTGGITMGQPLVENKAPVSVPRSAEFQYATTTPQTVSPTTSVPQQNASQAPVSTTPSNFDVNNKRNINTISKHEPIQNIIGNHDPNDILYLICTICTQTYGSPYGFRKHFRNQHGFEPRAEHTIVQTISATKTALHGPAPMATMATPSYQAQPTVSPPAIKLEPKESTGFMVQGGSNMERDKKSRSGTPPMPQRCPSESGSEHSVKSAGSQKSSGERPGTGDEVSERKYLECQECGKTFQLNDFGSYKRHCRQHNSVKVAGPYTCSDCHLSFPDQKALKEHYIVHVNESHSVNSEASKSADSVTVTKTETCFSCVKCDKQFDNMAVYKSHMTVHEHPPKLSPQPEVNKNKRPAESGSPATSKTVQTSLNVIPSQCIVKRPAESMTSQECPDSSWDDTVKPVPAPTEEKTDEVTVEHSDSGYSSSVGSNSMVHLDDKLNENIQKSPAGVVLRQKSLDSNSEFNEEQNSEESFFYKHKKFSHYRKRESFSSHSTDLTPPKQAKLSDSSSDRAPPVSSSTTYSVDFNKCDSSQSEDIKVTDKIKPESTESSDMGCGKDKELVEKQVKEFNLGKAEARHNLPFVWDRTTRSQRKTK